MAFFLVDGLPILTASLPLVVRHSSLLWKIADRCAVPWRCCYTYARRVDRKKRIGKREKDDAVAAHGSPFWHLFHDPQALCEAAMDDLPKCALGSQRSHIGKGHAVLQRVCAISEETL